MSTKTISKRVALATVVALGAGVLSLVSVSSASAAANVAITSSNVSAIAAAGVMNIGTASGNYTGNTIPSTASTVASTSASATTWASTGLLQVTNAAGNTNADTAQQAVLSIGGKLVAYTAITSNTAAVFSVTNGTLSIAGLTSDTAGVAYNGNSTAVAIYDTMVAAASTTQTAAVAATPVNSALPMIVSAYNLTNTAGTQITSAQAQTSAGSTSGLTLIGQVSVTSASTSVGGVVSLTNSKAIYIGSTTGTQTAITSAISSPADAYYPALGTSAYNKVQYGQVIEKDAYGVVLPSGHIVQATASNGAYVAFSGVSGGTSAAPASAGTSSTAFTTTAAGQAGIGFTVGSSVTTALSTTVTISVDGTVIASLPFTFTGEVAKVTLSGAMNGLVGGTASTSSTAPQNAFTVKAFDSAGNQIAVNTGNTSYPANYSAVSAGTVGTGISLSSVAYVTTATATVSQTGAFSCSSTVNATGGIQLQYVNVSGSIITSNALPLTCSGTPYSYSAKLDKSSYNPGDIATLTVTFKDSSGALAADVATAPISGKLASVTGAFLSPTNGALSNAASTVVNTDTTTNGVEVFKFIVGSTAGSYQAIADFPSIDLLGGSSQTVAYSIASSGTSLNDVLKGIVSLIASINKQIAALAKLVTKK
jgi:hypothetical protein